MQYKQLTLLASAVVLGLGMATGAQAFAPDITKSYSQGDKAAFLAGAHQGTRMNKF